MDVDFKNLDETTCYQQLKTLGYTPDLPSLLSAERIETASIAAGAGLTYNYAAKLVDDKILSNLENLAEEQQVIEKYTMILNGAVMNTGEERMVLHHLTRGQLAEPVTVEGNDIGHFYQEQRERIAAFSDAVHAGTVTGSTGKKFETAVQIGIGGSDLGPRALYLALTGYASEAGLQKLEARFISNVDPDDAGQVLAGIDFESTLFILVSKSGTTQETLTNMAFVIRLMEQASIPGLDPKKHMVAVTSQTSPLAASSDYLDSFYIDDYIGGRYSSTSAVGGVVLSLAFGADVFQQILEGAHQADRQALENNPMKNAPLMDALIGLFERNVLGCPVSAVLPYSQALSRFPAHLQQLDMESNGKQVNRFGKPLSYGTGPAIFGEPGTNGQHSFYQHLHQGTDIIPLQFIGFRSSQLGFDLAIEGSTSQRKLNANLAAQIAAFALGKQDENPNKTFHGNRPSSIICAEKLTPAALGALLAHFENKVMFQGLLWNINSFDQEGVQLGKILTKQILSGSAEDPILKAFMDLLT